MNDNYLILFLSMGERGEERPVEQKEEEPER
jgi:hypothetical protein